MSGSGRRNQRKSCRKAGFLLAISPDRIGATVGIEGRPPSALLLRAQFQPVNAGFPTFCQDRPSSRLSTPVQRSVTEEFTEGKRGNTISFRIQKCVRAFGWSGVCAARCLPGNTIWFAACGCAGCSAGDRSQATAVARNLDWQASTATLDELGRNILQLHRETFRHQKTSRTMGVFPRLCC
jgi:hypothetical protein